MCRYYEVRPLTKDFGVEVLGLNLATITLDDKLIQTFKNDLVRHRVLLFRDQSLTGDRQVELSQSLGTVESTFYKHPRSPHPDIFRVSNNEQEGCTQVGRSGWHIDGTFQMKPFQYQTMYLESVVEGGDTYFVPLHEFYHRQPKSVQTKWDRLWMITGRRQAPIHPLVYQHPHRKDATMVFHCGEPFVNGWYMDQDDNDGRHPQVDTTTILPAQSIQDELTSALDACLDDIGLRMQWKKGDFMINDNLGLAHLASEGTQTRDFEKDELRILHRTTIVGGPETVPRRFDGRKSFSSSHV